ncbi:MAG: hypothetical protein WB626_01985 [Bacteroidota bacterium]
MRVFKLAALFALAAIPLLIGRKHSRTGTPGPVVESDHIFDLELSSE